MADERRARPAPALVALSLSSVAFVLVVALLVVYVVHRGRTAPASFGVSRDEQAAMDAARQEIANLTTYRRAGFDQDWQRALDGTTGDLHAGQISKKKATLDGLTKGKVDSRGEVTTIGVEDSTSGKVTMLVFLNVYSVASGKSTLSSANRLEITASEVDGKWLLSDLQNVALS